MTASNRALTLAGCTSAILLCASALMPAAAQSNARAPLAVDSETGAMGTIGPKQNCYRWQLPVPAPVKVVVKARNGAGPIGAQVYSR